MNSLKIAASWIQYESTHILSINQQTEYLGHDTHFAQQDKIHIHTLLNRTISSHTLLNIHWSKEEEGGGWGVAFSVKWVWLGRLRPWWEVRVQPVVREFRNKGRHLVVDPPPGGTRRCAAGQTGGTGSYSYTGSELRYRWQQWNILNILYILW